MQAIRGIWHAGDQRWEFAAEVDVECAVDAARKDFAARKLRPPAEVPPGAHEEAEVGASCEADDAPALRDRLNRLVVHHRIPGHTYSPVEVAKAGCAELLRWLDKLTNKFGPEPANPSQVRPTVRTSARTEIAEHAELIVERRTLHFSQARHGRCFPLLPTSQALVADGSSDATTPTYRVSMTVIGEAPAPRTNVSAPTPAARPRRGILCTSSDEDSSDFDSLLRHL